MPGLAVCFPLGLREAKPVGPSTVRGADRWGGSENQGGRRRQTPGQGSSNIVHAAPRPAQRPERLWSQLPGPIWPAGHKACTGHLHQAFSNRGEGRPGRRMLLHRPSCKRCCLQQLALRGPRVTALAAWAWGVVTSASSAGCDQDKTGKVAIDKLRR